MSKHFELMDLASGNVVGDYPTEDEALEIIRRGVAEHGPEALADLGLAEVDGGETMLIAVRTDLLERAESYKSAQPV